jgi:hypothetical protein
VLAAIPLDEKPGMVFGKWTSPVMVGVDFLELADMLVRTMTRTREVENSPFA